jgi:hypothetical protein
MKNLRNNSTTAGWLVGSMAAVLGLATLLYVFPPTPGRALTKMSFPPATRLMGGNAWVPGGEPLLW